MDKYEEGQLIGKGSFGSVFLLRRKNDGQQFVVKKVWLQGISEKEKSALEVEVRLLSQLSHPAIVRYEESFTDAKSNQLCIVMGTLKKNYIHTYIY